MEPTGLTPAPDCSKMTAGHHGAHGMHCENRSIVKSTIWLLLLALSCQTIARPALADKRVALVIGNSAYQNVTRLDNPRNDAKLLADTLRSLGFTLVGGGARLDLDKAAFDSAIQSFSNQVQGADVALFYYAGHGVQVRGSNYLVPINANPTREADVFLQMVDIALVLSQMEGSGTKLNLIILDACRNNPFGGRGLRATVGGLGQMQAPEGTLISFATQPGSVAQDGVDGNSPYTKALAQTLRRPGLDVFQTFNEVGVSVMETTGRAQQPWLSTSPIKGSFFFTAPPAAATIAAPPTAAPAADEFYWNAIKASKSAPLFEEFIREFPASPHAAEARTRLNELNKSQVAVVAPPVQPTAPAPVQPPAPAPVQPAVGIFPPASGTAPLSAERERALKPKDTFRECETCPEMVVVPAGSFTMGSPKNESSHSDDELPQHKVTISKPFAVGKFEITVDQFAAFVKDSRFAVDNKCWTKEDGKFGERVDRSFRNPGFQVTGQHPATCLDWDTAKAYVKWLSKKTGKNYRLLSEAEWEYAARAGTTAIYPFGDKTEEICKNANGADVSFRKVLPTATISDCDDGYTFTAPVGSFKPNAFGLFEMLGNANEMIEDCYHSDYSGAPTDGSAWTTAEKDGTCGQFMRGGDFTRFYGALRPAARDRNTGRDWNFGLRVARTLAP